MRVYPHHQDTGGFFIAVLQKKSALPWTPGYRPKEKLLPWDLTKKKKAVSVDLRVFAVSEAAVFVSDKVLELGFTFLKQMKIAVFTRNE